MDVEYLKIFEKTFIECLKLEDILIKNNNSYLPIIYNFYNISSVWELENNYNDLLNIKIDFERQLNTSVVSPEFITLQRRKMTQKLKNQVLNRDNYTCQYCGKSKKKYPNLILEVDHIIPVSKGGRSELNNLQTLCKECNRQKSNMIL